MRGLSSFSAHTPGPSINDNGRKRTYIMHKPCDPRLAALSFVAGERPGETLECDPGGRRRHAVEDVFLLNLCASENREACNWY